MLVVMMCVYLCEFLTQSEFLCVCVRLLSQVFH